MLPLVHVHWGVFGCILYFIAPESKGMTLEEVERLYTSDSTYGMYVEKDIDCVEEVK